MKNQQIIKNLAIMSIFSTLLINSKAENHFNNKNSKEYKKEYRIQKQKSLKKQLFFATISAISKKFPIKQFFINIKKNNKELYYEAMEQFSDIIDIYGVIKEKYNQKAADLFIKTEFLEIYSESISNNYLEEKENNQKTAIPSNLKTILEEIFNNRIKLLKLGIEEASFDYYDDVNQDENESLSQDDDENVYCEDNEDIKLEDEEYNGYNYEDREPLEIDNNQNKNEDKHQHQCKSRQSLNQWIKKRIAVKDEVIRRRLIELTAPEKAALYRW